MGAIEVKTQKELDKALANLKPGDYVVCLGGTWDNPLIVRGSSSVVARGSSRVVARGSSRVEAWESSRVEAWESSSVVARGSSSVEAWESSRVEAWESSSVVAWESSSVVAWESSRVEAWESSRVEARESSSVVARGSSSVVARGSSRVEARESSRVEAWESSSVEAWESSRVVAWGSSRVVAWGSSRVEASKYVPVQRDYRHAGHVHGGVVIDLPNPADLDAVGWCDYFGVVMDGGEALLYKALDDDLSTPHARAKKLIYAIGTSVTAPDWDSAPSCGGGLHASPSPALARGYNQEATRYVRVRAQLEQLVVIDDKVKAPVLRVECEVDLHGDNVSVQEHS